MLSLNHAIYSASGTRGIQYLGYRGYTRPWVPGVYSNLGYHGYTVPQVLGVYSTSGTGGIQYLRYWGYTVPRVLGVYSTSGTGGIQDLGYRADPAIEPLLLPLPLLQPASTRLTCCFVF